MINYKSSIVQEDLKYLCKVPAEWLYIKNKTVLITGATGMLASYFSFVLMYLNENYEFNIKIILLARNKGKSESIFGNSGNVEFLIQDVCDEISYEGTIDYILHAAGGASPHYILNDPVGVIKANTLGTFNVLELAKKAGTEKVLFTSTREIYGKVENKQVITEQDMGTLDPLDARSCYPESKRMAETMLKSFSVQYGISFNALRIAHTYGPGMQIKNDGRVMADLLNDALEKRDIRLNSAGKAERAFCYIADAIEAMFRILIKGGKDEAYNIANETEPIEIIALAQLIQEIAGTNKGVIVGEDHSPKPGYCNYDRVKLDTFKMEQLGWTPKVTLKEGLAKTLRSFS